MPGSLLIACFIILPKCPSFHPIELGLRLPQKLYLFLALDYSHRFITFSRILSEVDLSTLSSRSFQTSGVTSFEWWTTSRSLSASPPRRPCRRCLAPASRCATSHRIRNLAKLPSKQSWYPVFLFVTSFDDRRGLMGLDHIVVMMPELS